MEEFLTTAPEDERFVGLVKEVAQVSHKTTIFYKCPPHLVLSGNIEKYGLSQEEYFNSYFRENLDQKTGMPVRKPKSVMVIEANSPFLPGATLEQTLFKKLNDTQSLQEEEEETEAYETNQEQDETAQELDESQEVVTDAHETEDVEFEQAASEETPSVTAQQASVETEQSPCVFPVPVPDFSKLEEESATHIQKEQPIPSFVYSGGEGETYTEDLDADLGAEEYI